MVVDMGLAKSSDLSLPSPKKQTDLTVEGTHSMKYYSISDLNRTSLNIDFGNILGSHWQGTVIDLLRCPSLFNVIKIKLATSLSKADVNLSFSVWCARKALNLTGNTDRFAENFLKIAEQYGKGLTSRKILTKAWDQMRPNGGLDVHVIETLQCCLGTHEESAKMAYKASSKLMEVYYSLSQLKATRQEQVDTFITLITDRYEQQKGACDISGGQHTPVNVGFNSVIIACKYCGQDLQPHQ